MTWRLEGKQRLVIGLAALNKLAIKAQSLCGFGAAFMDRAPRNIGGGAAVLDVPLARFGRLVPAGCFTPPVLFEAPGAAGGRASMAAAGRRKLGGGKLSHALVVEDSLLIAVDLEQALHALGVARVSIAATVEEALEILKLDEPQFALLDLGLGVELSLPVAERLEELGIPFAFATGYNRQIELGQKYAKVPTLQKPYGKEELKAFLQSLYKK